MFGTVFRAFLGTGVLLSWGFDESGAVCGRAVEAKLCDRRGKKHVMI